MTAGPRGMADAGTEVAQVAHDRVAAPMTRRNAPATRTDAAIVGAWLRELRRGAGYRSVDAAAAAPTCPASRHTIYTYERGGQLPSLGQFLDLVSFFVLDGPRGPTAKPDVELRTQGVAAVARALSLPAYQVTRTNDLVTRMQPEPGAKP